MPIPVRPGELSLIRTEVEAMGELLATERLERKTDIDRIRIELESLKKAITEVAPEFDSVFQRCYSEILQSYDPENHTGLRTQPGSSENPHKNRSQDQTR